MSSPSARPPGIYSAAFLWTTVGAVALVFLNAFENLAVTTVMPLVSDDLNGEALYALAFAAPLAAGVIGLVVGGNWSDRLGPTAPLYVSGALFIVGLLIAGTAQHMGVLVAGRLIQGFGGGAVNVALYVVVARVYPAALHQKIFAAFAAAWVVPSLIGPVLAGLVAEHISWHWVFLGVVGLVLIAIVMMIPAVRSLRGGGDPEHPVPWSFTRIGWSILAAGAVLAVSLAEGLPDAALTIAVVVASLAVALIALRPLVPRGTLRAARGLPAVIASRGFIAAAFFGAEVYIPYLLIDEYAFSPSIAGLSLTGAAIMWAFASWLQGALGERLHNRVAMRLGAALVVASIAVVVAVAALHLHPIVLMAAWVVGAGGMGLVYPRLSTMTLALSPVREQGFSSAALQIADSLGAALALALTGIIASLLGHGHLSFVAVFVFTGLLALAAFAVGGRVAEREGRIR